MLHIFLYKWNFRSSTQPANIGSQDIARTSPSNVLRTSPKDPIWPSRRNPDLTSWGRPEMTPIDCPNMTLKGRPWEVDSGRPQDIFRASPRGISKHWSLDVPKFLLIFFQNFFDWPNLSKSISTLKVFWGPSQTFKMDNFLGNS